MNTEKYWISKETSFFSLLSEAKKTEFLNLDEARKQKVSSAIKESGCKTEPEIIKVWESVTTNVEEKWLAEAPTEYRKLWESLDTKTQAVITAQSRIYTLDTPYRIKNFWETRTIQTAPAVTTLNESKVAEKQNLGYTSDYLESVKKSLDRLNNKY
jgi:hypothetical protein